MFFSLKGIAIDHRVMVSVVSTPVDPFSATALILLEGPIEPSYDLTNQSGAVSVVAMGLPRCRPPPLLVTERKALRSQATRVRQQPQQPRVARGEREKCLVLTYGEL